MSSVPRTASTATCSLPDSYLIEHSTYPSDLSPALMWYAHRDKWLTMHSEHGLYIGLKFPDAFPGGCAWDIQGWFWGKPM